MSQKTGKINALKLVFSLFGVSFLVFYCGIAQASSITPESVISLLNADRVKNGLQSLEENHLLSQAAQYKATDMFQKNYFAHTSPEGVEPWFWFGKAGYEYKSAGENLASNFSDAESQEAAWMNSPTHRKNILNNNFNQVGVAVMNGKINGENYSVTVELFAQPLYLSMTEKEANQVTLPEAKVLGESIGKNSLPWIGQSIFWTILGISLFIIIGATIFWEKRIKDKLNRENSDVKSEELDILEIKSLTAKDHSGG